MPAISSKALLCSKLHWDHKEKQGNSIVAGRGRWMTFGFQKTAAPSVSMRHFLEQWFSAGPTIAQRERSPTGSSAKHRITFQMGFIFVLSTILQI